ncbi:MAG: futalosine hydrolase [Pirellula sp.]|jgi:futalosine hydrolase|nr:futalosine hydrolase [Pirellula sp.]
MKTDSRLLLVPTDLERQKLPKACVEQWLDRGHRIEICGFGQVVAAARTMQLLATGSFDSVTLVGIAGSLENEVEVGCAVQFGTVYCDGIGVGQGAIHRSAMDMGWHQWPREPKIDDTIQLSAHAPDHPLPGLVSVLAASATPTEAAWRRSRFPLGKAEDMEGFGVAVSCRLANVPLTIVRGISNRAGDRDHTNWNIEGSLKQAMLLILQKALQPQEASE